MQRPDETGASELPAAVLFACTMNAVRSPMAAAILRHLAGHRCYVQSAGVRAGEIDGFMVAVMEEIGIDVSRHTPHTLVDLNDTSFDLIVTLSPEDFAPADLPLALEASQRLRFVWLDEKAVRVVVGTFDGV